MATVTRCPSCDRALQVPDELLGQEVRCPSCQATFIASATAPAAPPPLPAPAEPQLELPPREPLPRFRPEDRREYDTDDYDDDDYDRPRRRRGSRADARAAVSGPATALMVVGGLAIATSMLVLVLVLAGAHMPGRFNKNDPALNGLSAVIGIVWSIVILVAASTMKGLSSYRFAMAGAIVAMLPCHCCFLLGLPFGIWALIVINKPEVRSAFWR
jgi:hypothetical protein